VARLADDGDAVDGWLVFEPNNPKVQIKSVTSIAADADKSWSVQFDCFVNVGRGRVDALRFDVPDDWTGLLIIEPPFRSKLVASAAGSPRRLVVRPDESIRGRLKFTIRGKIAPSQAAALRVPLLRPRGAATASEFVRLPTLVEEQPIVWNRRGLAPTTLPEELSITADFSMTIYRIAGGEPQAVLQAPDQAAGILRASLANVYVAWRADGSCRGLMLADVRPAGASHCLVEMPEPLALEAVRVDGRLIAAGRQSEKTWRVALPSRWRPQRLELLFSAPKESINVERSRIRLVAPTIEGAAVGRTLWTIFSPDGRRATTGAASAREIGVKERQRIRVESIARLLADDAWAPNEPGESWRRDWLDRLREEYDDFRLLAAEDDATDGRALESARQMLRQSSDETWQYVAVAVEEPATGDFVALEQVAESAQAAAIALGGRVYSSDGRRIVLRIPRDRVEQFVDQWEVDRPAGAAPLTIGNRAPWTDSMEALWRPTADRGDALYLATEGAAAVVDLRTASRSWLRELASALFFVAIVVGVGAMSRRRAVNDLAVRHAHLAGVAIGLAWWLFLSPSWFGWAIVAASLFASVRNAWPLPKSADTTITRIKIPR
jgi:hypothetical protein